MLQRGDTDTVPDRPVSKLQGDLLAWRSFAGRTPDDPTPLKVDGDFGPKTEAAVQSMQATEGLEPTGVYDAFTHTTLTDWVAREVTTKLRRDLETIQGDLTRADRAQDVVIAGKADADHSHNGVPPQGDVPPHDHDDYAKVDHPHTVPAQTI